MESLSAMTHVWMILAIVCFVFAIAFLLGFAFFKKETMSTTVRCICFAAAFVFVVLSIMFSNMYSQASRFVKTQNGGIEQNVDTSLDEGGK